MSDVTAKRVEVVITLKTLILGAAVIALAAAVVAVLDALLLVFIGVFLALVFEWPVRAMMRRTKLGRGASAAIVVLGSVAVATGLALLLLIPLAGAVRDFLQGLPAVVENLRNSDELSFLGDTGASENAQAGAAKLAARVPDAISAFLGVAGSVAGVALSLFSVIFIALFLVMDMPRLRRLLGSVLMPSDSDRWLGVWDRITETISRWAIGALLIALIAGTVQGGTAWLLGSSYWLALGLISAVLDLIPTIGATIATFILVPTLLAEEGLTAGLIMLAVALIYQQIENNVLSPTIYGKAVDISPFFIMIGVTLFGALLGVLGALVAVPVSAAIQIVVGEVTKARREQVAAAKALEAPIP